MTDRTQEKTQGVLGDVKAALKGVKGAGDTIRGTVNESIDTAFNEREGEVANRAVKERGIADMEATDQHFTQTNTETAKPHTGLRTGGVGGKATALEGSTTGAGAHSRAVGNMGSRPPQGELGGEPAPATQRF